MNEAEEAIAAQDLHNPVPRVHLLTNGRLTVMLTAAGAGYTDFERLALTRWMPDRTRDADGYFVYVRDLDTGRFWSAGYQPVPTSPDHYAARFEDGCAHFERRDGTIETRMSVCVAPTGDVELRRCTLFNHSDRIRRIELTSYAEAVLNTRAGDAGHPAFSKLFVQTEWQAVAQILLARRRLRSPDDAPVWLVHRLVREEGAHEVPAFETDRARFIGRGRTLAAPAALDAGAALSGTAGNVLDAVVSLRCVVVLPPGARADVTFVLGAAADCDTATALATRYATPEVVDAVFQQASAQAVALRADAGLPASDVPGFRRLAAALLYGDPALHTDRLLPEGDAARAALPLVACLVKGHAGLEKARRVMRLLAYARLHSLQASLLLLADGVPPETLAPLADPGADVHVVNATAMAEGRYAQVFLADGVASLQEAGAPLDEASVVYRPAVATTASPAPSHPPPALQFDNGYGGFREAGRAYVIRVTPDGTPALRRPPLPWTNVIANEGHGFLVTESGAGYTWGVNSRQNRITPWYNDPVSDPHGEALYVRDEEARVFWSPTPGPVPAPAAYEVEHGFGYTSFRHESHGLAQTVVQFVPRHDPVKITQMRITNLGTATRRLSVFAYQRLVLGVSAAETVGQVRTSFVAAQEALLAVNPFNHVFAERVAFSSVVAPDGPGGVSYTTDRTAFLGRHGGTAAPAALVRPGPLEGRVGGGLDPCMAFQVPLVLAPGATATVTVLLGEAADSAAAEAVLAHYRTLGAPEAALTAVQAFWRHTLSRLQVETPVPELDLMVNGWLVYQTLSCRLWGRSAYYQSGGAYGFRDQLQDAAALVYLLPHLTRVQILRHAAHQFVEGDVMHWWHPPDSQGIRTRFSDDLLWLPYVTAFYIQATGDAAVLDEAAPFLTARCLEPGEDEAFLTPRPAGIDASVYVHCCLTLDRSLTRGAHGLPLMGTGDWNDGMNRVGREGRGESVWLGFFLYQLLLDFLPFCRQRGDQARVARYEAYRADLAVTLNDTGWDGAWYRRAYYDNGAPLGTAEGDECRIDALAQAWAVLSKAAPPARARQALDAMEAHLVSEADGIIRLLTPAFDRTPHDPGYIKGYLPGVRENGGQYTHAALWAVQALAEAGRHDRAGTLLKMLSPISHAATPEAADVYRVEPYVIAADVYGVAPHVGRGGWTWYTGSAGWMYRVAVESLLGVTLVDGTALVVQPRLPAAWPGFRLTYRVDDAGTVYEIDVRKPDACTGAVTAASVDGRAVEVAGGAARLPLLCDGQKHIAVVTLG